MAWPGSSAPPACNGCRPRSRSRKRCAASKPSRLTNRGGDMPSKLVDPQKIPTQTFDWGLIKPLVAKANTDNPAMSMLHVVLLPGTGHDPHNHPEADEILYILAPNDPLTISDPK